MSFNFQFGGHATTKEAEAEIVRAVHKFWEVVKEHADTAWNNTHTAHHGVGHVEALTDPDNPDKNVTVDEEGNRHLDVPVTQASTPSGGSNDPTALAPDSYSTPSSSLPSGGEQPQAPASPLEESNSQSSGESSALESPAAGVSSTEAEAESNPEKA